MLHLFKVRVSWQAHLNPGLGHLPPSLDLTRFRTGGTVWIPSLVKLKQSVLLHHVHLAEWWWEGGTEPHGTKY